MLLWIWIFGKILNEMSCERVQIIILLYLSGYIWEVLFNNFKVFLGVSNINRDSYLARHLVNNTEIYTFISICTNTTHFFKYQQFYSLSTKSFNAMIFPRLLTRHPCICPFIPENSWYEILICSQLRLLLL